MIRSRVPRESSSNLKKKKIGFKAMYVISKSTWPVYKKKHNEQITRIQKIPQMKYYAIAMCLHRKFQFHLMASVFAIV